MENKYLEKVAAAWERRLAGTQQGQAMGFTPRTQNFQGSNRVTNADMLGKLNLNKPQHSILDGGSVQVKQRQGFLGLGGEKTVGWAQNTGTRLSGDALAAKGSGSVLAKQVAKTSGGTGAKGFLNKALGMARKNPLATAGLAAGAAFLGGKAVGSKQEQPQFQQYYG
jgi:hypothetical protein